MWFRGKRGWETCGDKWDITTRSVSEGFFGKRYCNAESQSLTYVSGWETSAGTHFVWSGLHFLSQSERRRWTTMTRRRN